MGVYLGTEAVSFAGVSGGYGINGHLLTTSTYTFNLGQTNYSTLTVSTTAAAITLPATTYTSTASTTVAAIRIGEDYGGTVIDRNNHDYVVFTQVKVAYGYGGNDVSSVIHPIRTAYVRDYQEGKYRNSVTASTGKLTTAYTKNGSYITSTTVLLYQKADGNYAISAQTYGIYGTATPSFATSNNKDYININCSGFNVRAHATYAPVDTLNLIDPSKTIITITCQVYETDRSSYTNIYDAAYELAANP